MPVYTISESKLRTYAKIHEQPEITFKPNSTEVVLEIDDGLTIISDGINIDEHVLITLPGKRTFAGIVFDTEHMTVEGMKDPEARDYFDAFVDSIMCMFEEQLCVCGGVGECYCDKPKETA